MFDPLSQQLGQSLIVENRPGGGGTVGAATVARAEPDGFDRTQKYVSARRAALQSDCHFPRIAPQYNIPGCAWLFLV